jgi:hypothetical protein
MEISITLLFVLVRDQQGMAVCIGQAAVMAFVGILTGVYHHLVHKAFDPLLAFTPTSIVPPTSHTTAQQDLFIPPPLVLNLTVNLPKDCYGVCEKRAAELKKGLGEVAFCVDRATINERGKIRVEERYRGDTYLRGT